MSTSPAIQACSICGKPCRGKTCMTCIKARAKPVYDTCYVCGAPVSRQRHPHKCKACAGKDTGERLRSKKTYPEFLACQWCGKQFPFRYFYRFRDVKYCSHKCCTLARHEREGNTKEGVESRVVEFIKEQGRYCSRKEIQHALHLSDQTFRHWSVDCDDLNHRFGFFVNERMKLRDMIIKEIATGKHHNLRSVCDALGASYAEARKIAWRKLGGLRSFFEKAGIARSQAGLATKEELEYAIVEEIKREGRQIPAAELVKRLHFDYERFKAFGCSVRELHARAGVKMARNSSYQELIATKVLKSLGANAEAQKKFDDCRSPITGRRLWFDFFLPAQNTILEVDGEQHYDENHGLASKKLRIHDKVKNDYAKAKGIALERIRVKPKDTFEQRFTETVKKILGVVKAVELLERPQAQSAAKPEREGSETIRKE